MKRIVPILLVALAWCQIDGPRAGAATLEWSDSNPPELVAGWCVYRGEKSGEYIERIETPFQTLGLYYPPNTTNFFAVTAKDNFGLESEFSTEVVYIVPRPAPLIAPVTLRFSGSGDVRVLEVVASDAVDSVPHAIGAFQISMTNAPQQFYRAKME
jgi:hypothetical protein